MVVKGEICLYKKDRLSNLIRRVQQSTISDFSEHAVGGRDTLPKQTWLHLLTRERIAEKQWTKKRSQDSKWEGGRWGVEKEKRRGRVYFRARLEQVLLRAESVWGQFEYLIWVIHRYDSQTTPVLINIHRKREREEGLLGVFSHLLQYLVTVSYASLAFLV